MTDMTKLLLKHGIEGLLEQNEEFFKNNITRALALKLNENVQLTKNAISQKLLNKPETTAPSENLNEFLSFISNFKSGTHTFKNGSNINITESDIKDLKELFESLNPINREKMVSEILVDGTAFKQHLNFFQKAKVLL